MPRKHRGSRTQQQTPRRSRGEKMLTEARARRIFGFPPEVISNRPKGSDNALKPMIAKTRRIAGTSEFKVVVRG